MTMRWLKAFLRDTKGVAAIEFAFVVPAMITLFAGAWELSQGMICYLKLLDAADTVVDITCQQTTLTTANIDDIYTAAQLVMTPNAGSALGVAVASVTFNATTGAPAVAWQATRGTATALSNTALTALANGLGNAGESVIITQVTYNYTSLLKLVLPGGINLAANAMQRPRIAVTIPLS